MLTYSFDHRGTENLYTYLYNCMKRDIVNGVLKPHEKLPSKRNFAANHGISVITVENAYGQLLAEGYIYSKPKSGFFVSPIQSQIDKEMRQTDLINTPILSEQADFMNLSSNHMPAEHFPFSVWAKLTRRILTEQDAKLLVTPPAGGVVLLREAITKHLKDFRGIHVSPEQVIVGAGTEYLYSLIVQLLGRDKIYGLENPSSKKIRRIYQAMGAKIVPLEMDHEGVMLTPENLTMPDIIQISPSHHFPTGIVTSVSRRYGLLQWANESMHRYIIEDDYDSEFRLQGKPIPSLFSMDATDKVIYFNTFTKSLAPTIRISYMVLPLPLLKRFYEQLGFYACTVSNFEQYTLAAFIKEQYFEKHINRMRNHYKGVRDQFIRLIEQSKLGEHVRISEENAGLHFLLTIKTGESDVVLKQKANAHGIQVSFLSDYYNQDYNIIKEEYQHTAIINYAGLGEADLQRVVEQLTLAWVG
ncbi:MAG: PLP-dependent aminotransferase family protein [Lachnospiraceae bacterium]|nr:PLP-dependent aminotransferase family protein [Lachnospiraceae bacterium]